MESRMWATQKDNGGPMLPTFPHASSPFSSRRVSTFQVFCIHRPPLVRFFTFLPSVCFLFTYGHVHSPNDNIKVLFIVMQRGSDETGRSFISAPVVSDRERRIRGAATNRYWRPLRTRDAARLSFLLKHRYVHSNTANFRPHYSGILSFPVEAFLSLVIYLEISIGRNNLWFEKINRWISLTSF